jgi:hypothetical protein
MKKCWHSWNKFVEKKIINHGLHTYTKKTKVCRKCGETRIKESVW